MSSPADPIVITGANGHLGQALARRWAGRPIRAVVRSERAAGALRALPEDARPEIHVLDYHDEDALRRAGEGCSAWVNLVGILREGANARYVDAHERTALHLARAAEKASAQRIVSLSILGAAPDSPNPCLASKGRADALLVDSAVPTTVLRLPMVIGRHEIATAALGAQARARLVFLTRGGRTIERPIDTRDVAEAVRAASELRDGRDHVLDLAGPAALSHRELVSRVASVLGTTAPRVVPVPFSLVAGFAAIMERVSPDPPLTRAMLGVLEHDDEIDPAPAAARLGIALTDLDDTLRATFSEEPE